MNADGIGGSKTPQMGNTDPAQLLLDINNAVVSHLELPSLLRAVSACLKKTLPHDFAGLAMYHPETGHLRVHGLSFPEAHPFFKEGQVIPVEGTPGGLAVKTGQPVLRHRPDPEEFPAAEMKQAQALGIKSGIVVPLIRHGQTLGTLMMSSFQESKYTEADVKLLEQIAAQVAIAVQNVRNHEAARQAEQEMARERDRSRLLLEINNAVVSKLDLSSLLKTVSTSLRQVISHDSAFIALCNPGDREMHVRALDKGAIESSQFQEGLLIPVDGTPEDLAMRTRHPVIVKTLEELLAFPSPMMQFAAEQGIKSGCAIPLIAHDRVLGALGVVSLREASFTENDARLLEQCSTQIAIAVQNALNFEKARQAETESRQERDRSALLLEINNALVSSLELSDLVREVSRCIQQLIQHDCVGLAVYDEMTGKFFAQAVSSNLEPMLQGIYYDPEGTVSGVTFSSGKPVYVWPLDSSSFPSTVTKGFIDKGLKTLYAIPLLVHGRILGVMSISSVRDNAFSQSDQLLFQQIGKQVALATANTLAVRDLEALKNKLAQEKLYLEDEIRTELNFDEIVGQSDSLRRVLQMVETVAPSDSTVLLLGETGTGKELIARAVHNRSRRKSRTFVKTNCAAIPTGLLESELFGHERGAFTGAIAQKIGRLELADQGTLFLDEVGDIPFDIQPKLLRALQEREFERLGSTHTKKVNIRLVAATNRNLEKMMEDREFRSDLYYRLNVFPIRIPPLRDRPGDIPLLVRYFAQKSARQMQKQIESIPAEAMERLQQWHWPGNVRELENFVERAVILTQGDSLHVPLSELKLESHPVTSKQNGDTLKGTEREHIIRVLRETRGILAGPNGAAEKLGVKRTTLQYKMKKLGITRDHWWPGSPE